jgi:hypothetical protein
MRICHRQVEDRVEDFKGERAAGKQTESPTWMVGDAQSKRAGTN